MVKTILFHRNYQVLRGGVIKMWEYFQHINATPGFEAKIAFAPGAAARPENPWTANGVTPVTDWRSFRPDAFFLGGRDWEAWETHPASTDPTIPIINLIQHPRMRPNATNAHIFSQPAIRIAVSDDMAAITRQGGITPEPILVIPCGLDLSLVPPLGGVPKTTDIAIAGVKEPALARTLAAKLGADPSLRIDTLDHQVPRSEYLQRITAAQVAIFLPLRSEPFYLAALEGMATGTIVICPDAGGNRSYLRDNLNGFMPAYDQDALVAAALHALAIGPESRSEMIRQGADTARRFSLEAERAAFQDVLANLDDLWRQAQDSATAKAAQHATATPARTRHARTRPVRTQPAPTPPAQPARPGSSGPAHTVLVTGLPRSGTTLVSELLNDLPNTVALDEPGLHSILRATRSHEPNAVSSAVEAFVRHHRSSILVDRIAISTNVGGRIGGNHYSAARDAAGLRTEVAAPGSVAMTKPLTPDFLLAIKSPAPVTIHLKACAAELPTYAIVRNPLAILASWSSIDLALHDQPTTRIARMHPRLARRLQAARDIHDRHIALMHWFFEQYLTLLPAERIIRYEDIVASRGRALTAITPAANTLDRAISSQNRNPLYNPETVRILGERLLADDGPCWALYQRADVQSLMEAFSDVSPLSGGDDAGTTMPTSEGTATANTPVPTTVDGVRPRQESAHEPGVRSGRSAKDGVMLDADPSEEASNAHEDAQPRPRKHGKHRRRRPGSSGAPASAVPDGTNIIVTGTPRSGTTLTCSLLNRLPNTVALNEPFSGRLWAPKFRQDRAFQSLLQTFIADQRASLLSSGTAASYQLNGTIPDNTFGDVMDETGRRQNVTRSGQVSFDKPLAPDFTLVIKTPVPFTTRLNALVDLFPTYALVRNPVATLASWNTISTPPESKGAERASRFHPQLAADLEAAADVFDRQIVMLKWFFQQYASLLPAPNVIRYEDLIASGGAALSVMTPAAATLNTPLESRNTNPLYDREKMLEIGKRLLASEGAYWNWYTPAEVSALLDELQQTS